MGILIPVFLLIVIPGLVILLIVKLKRKPGQTFKDTLGVTPLTLLALLIFLFSFASSGWVPDSLDSWRVVLVQRQLWQMIGPVLLVLAALKEAADSVRGRGYERVISSRMWMLAGAILAVGLYYCINPMLDLIQGPVSLQGTATPNIYRHIGGRTSYLVWGLRLESADGSVNWLNAGDLSLRELKDTFKGYPHGRKAHLVVLYHLGAVLDIRHTHWQ
ncbi:hypothetical protein IAD21_00463 [Abditibacteriota bacterium]|nr:hypothetical protein IAD21_00463 [Abditibacteriota bacterium]